MCLAIPGKVVQIFDRQGLRMAKVEFGKITREACLECVPQAVVGSWVLVHVGMALSVIDEEEAARTFALFAELDQLGELDAEQQPGEEG